MAGVPAPPSPAEKRPAENLFDSNAGNCEEKQFYALFQLFIKNDRHLAGLTAGHKCTLAEICL
jgi:hypothetical protein